ncbi:MAG: hypothetical protein JW934_20355 [Anaerolineae bacterium]|nr:hypothetical protein [Anaerolineae bacterium]
MNQLDWRWKIGEAIERLRTRYEFIGRKTGAPFLALVYPPAVEMTALKEWHTQTAALRPEMDVQTVDVLQVTQAVLADLGAEAVVDALRDPMPGADPQSELGQLWVDAAAAALRNAAQRSYTGKPVFCLERLAALYPAAGPRDLMRFLWDNAALACDAPIVILIPGSLRGMRTYAFLDQKSEFMYRGDLL